MLGCRARFHLLEAKDAFSASLDLSWSSPTLRTQPRPKLKLKILLTQKRIYTMSTTVQTIPGGKAWYTPPTGPMTLGEAPIYRSSDSTLHWVDCLKEPPELHILKVDPESGDPIGAARVLILEDSVSVMSFRKEIPGSYICAYYGGVAFLSEQTGELEIVREIIPKVQRDERRFNDGGVDAQGRFWLAEIDIKV
jgi:hypothetical protein